jgi:hypothetical protein
MCDRGVPFGLIAAGLLLAGCSERDLTAPRDIASSTERAGTSHCEHVSGAFVFTRFQFTSPTTAVGDGIVQGDLSGTFHADYFNIQQRGKGVIQMQAHHTITRSTGTIRTSDEILLLPDQDPAVARANSRLDLIAGTDAYQGVTGLLHTHGQLNLVTLAGALQYKGQVCVP